MIRRSSPMLLCLASLLIAFQGRADPPLSLAQLKAALLNVVPTNSGVQDFFEKALNDPAHFGTYEKLIAGDPDLKRASEGGSSFRSFYVGRLAKKFGDDASVFFNPEQSLIRWIYQTPSAEKAPVPQPISDHKATQLAWQDTLTQFSFSPSTSFSELTQNRYTDTRHANAYDYFRRRYYAYLQREETTPQTQKPDIDDAKQRVRERIQALRVKNFLDAAENTSHGSSTVTFQDGKKKLRVPLYRLRHATVQIRSEVSAPPTHALIQKSKSFHPSFPKRWALAASRYLIGHPHADKALLSRGLRSAQAMAPVTQHASIQLTFPHDIPAITISESDFSQLLHQMHNPKTLLSQNGAPEERFLLEASRRDALLADLTAYMDEYGDPNVNALRERLLTRMRSPEMKAGGYSVSLKDDNPGADSKLGQMRWFGFSIHPDYWKIRDQAAVELGKPTLLQEPAPNGKRLQSRTDDKSMLGILHSAGKNRKLPPFSSGKWRNLALFSTLAAGLAGGTISYMIQNATWDLPIPNIPGLGSGMGSGKGNGEIKSIDSYNNAPPSNASEKDHNNAEKKIVYQIIDSRVPDERIPIYFNLTQQAWLPYTDDYDLLKEDQGFELTPLSQRRGQITLKALLPHNASMRRVAIIQPSGYKIVSLKLVNSKKGLLEYGKDYTVYTGTHTGLIHVKLRADLLDSDGRYSYLDSTGYTYEASYERADYSPFGDPALANLDKGVLKRLTDELRQTGATQLARSLNAMIDARDHVTLSDIDEVLGRNGLYTYDPEAPYQEILKQDITNPFIDFRKFLRDGIYYYQCTGSNTLERQFLKTYLERTAISNTDVINVTGFVHPRGGDGNITAGNGHLHTMVTRTDRPYTFSELDATPRTTDPKYAGHHPLTPTPKRKKLEEDKDANAESVLPPKIKEERDSDDTSNDDPPKPEGDPQKFKKLLELKRTRLFEALQKTSAPVTDTSVISRLVLDYANGHLTLDQTLRGLVALNLGLSPFTPLRDFQADEVTKGVQELLSAHPSKESALNEQLKRNSEKLKSDIRDEMAKEKEKRPSASRFMINAEVQASLLDLSRFLAATNWHAAKNCDDSMAALGAGTPEGHNKNPGSFEPGPHHLSR